MFRKNYLVLIGLDKYCSRPRQNLIEALNLTVVKRYRVYDLLEQRREE